MYDKYIYGIINSNSEAALAITGPGGSGPVYTIAHKGLACVLSDYTGRELGSMSKEEVVRCLLAHQIVVEQVMREHTVLPVKFGTVLAASDEVLDLLSQCHQQFVEALTWIADKVEVEVAATWDTAQVLREISAEPEIVRARESITSRPRQPTVEECLRLGNMVKASLDRHRDRYRERMIAFLKPVAIDVQPNALVSEQMVMNVAFLVEKVNQREFDSQVGQLNDLCHGQINFRIIGPLPPYSFATVEVSRPNWEKLSEAQRMLGLPQVILEARVRKAYREMAAACHPDVNPGDNLAGERLAKIQEASSLLLAYCRKAEGLGDPKKGLLLTREAVERAFLTIIRRSATEVPQATYNVALPLQ